MLSLFYLIYFKVEADSLSPCWSKVTNNKHVQSYNVTPNPNKNLELEYAKNFHFPVCTLLLGESICIQITSGALQSKSPNPNFLPMLEHCSELIQIELP